MIRLADICLYLSGEQAQRINEFDSRAGHRLLWHLLLDIESNGHSSYHEDGKVGVNPHINKQKSILAS